MVIYDLKTMQICEMGEKCIVALGAFDGCHVGHMAVFSKCIALARKMRVKSAVYTFSRPPRDYFANSGGMCLFSQDEKLRAIRDSGIDFLCIDDFEAVRELDGMSFLEDILVSRLGAVGACCGFNYTFGRGASFSAENLRDFFENRGGCVEICDKIDYKGKVLSSSLLREFVEKGEVEALLPVCRPYSVYSVVEHGKELGRTIGIPTINQKIPECKILPRRGVYITECEIGEDVYPSVTNVGLRPTVEDSDRVNMETHIIGYNGNLYGSGVRVNFYKFIRDEVKFSSIDELRCEIAKNIEMAKEYFGR